MGISFEYEYRPSFDSFVFIISIIDEDKTKVTSKEAGKFVDAFRT